MNQLLTGNLGSIIRVVALTVTISSLASLAFGPQSLSAAEEEAGCSPQSGKSCITRNGNAYNSKACTSNGTACFTCTNNIGFVCIACYGDAEGAQGVQTGCDD